MNYWDILKQADAALANGRFREAERLHDEATAARASSPRRRFVSETLPDGARRLWHSLQRRRLPETPGAGRWERSLAGFAGRFAQRAAEHVDRGLRLAELRPEDDADANQPALEAALYLTTRSRLHAADPARAVRLLRAAFRTAAASGRPFAADLVRPDLPLGAEDRLWLVRQGEAILAPLVGTPGEERTAWTGALLGLLDPAVFAGDETAEEERRWLAARLADAHLDDPEAVLERLRSYLALLRRPRGRADRIRLRTVQILANIDRPRLPVARYDEALALMGQEEPEPGTEAAVQMREIAAVIAARRPTETPGRAWVSAARAAEGRCHFVFWWDAAPTDGTATCAASTSPM